MSRSIRNGSNRFRSLLVVGLLCCSLVAGAGVAAATSDLYVTVSDVVVSNDEPETGEAITVTPTIRHSGEQSGGFHITEVVLMAPGRGEVARAEDVGSIASGETLSVPLGVTFDTAGEKRLLVKVRGAKEDGAGHLQRLGYVERPVYVSVSEPSSDTATPPRVRIDVGRAVAGTDVPVTVTVSNGDDEKISDLRLRLDSLNGSVEARTRVKPMLEAGNMTRFTFDVKPEETGETTLKATLRYGDGESVKAFQPMQVESLREDVDVYASVVERNESTLLQYRITNRGNAPIHDVAISGQTGDTRLPGATAATIEAASTETVTVPVGSAVAGTATVEATYSVDNRTGRVERSVALTGADDSGADAERSTAGFGWLPLSGIGAALVGLGGVAVVGYRLWER